MVDRSKAKKFPFAMRLTIRAVVNTFFSANVYHSVGIVMAVGGRFSLLAAKPGASPLSEPSAAQASEDSNILALRRLSRTKPCE